ncbi:hypothetical protein FACS1894217_06430 [Clostridia bacterium]|nr:hypothetical protein FACS1894217_06430 [Clostridia bacterium]
MKKAKITPPPPCGKFCKLLALILMLTLALSVNVPAFAADSVDPPVANGTDITAKFTDPNFKAIVLELLDKDTIYDTDVAGIDGLDVTWAEISSLSGIEYFTGLTELYCSFNEITELDLSQNTALTRLEADNNALTKLDVSKNTALTALWLFHNELPVLDVSKNTALTDLVGSFNQLKTIDVSKNTALTRINFRYNELPKIDVSKNTALESLYIDHNQLTELDLSKNDKLAELYCNHNYLSSEAAITGLNKNKITGDYSFAPQYVTENAIVALPDEEPNTATEWVVGQNESGDEIANAADAYAKGGDSLEKEVKSDTAVTFAIDIPLSAFDNLYIIVDGELVVLVKDVDYTVVSGSTVIKLLPAALKKYDLKDGETTKFQAKFVDKAGAAIAIPLGVKLLAADTSTPSPSPNPGTETSSDTSKNSKTGDTSVALIALLILLLAGGGIFITRKVKN